MADLNDIQKLLVVQRWACFATATEIVTELKRDYGFEASIAQLMYYDPEHPQSKNLAQKWRDIYKETRDAFLESAKSIPIATQSYRLLEMQKMYRDNPRNTQLRTQLLEQAAKEVGGMFTNRRELTGANGGAVPILITAIEAVMPDGDGPS